MRTLVSYLIAIAGGAGSQILAAAWNLGGLGGYLFFLSCVTVVVLVLVPFSEGYGPGGGRRRAASR